MGAPARSTRFGEVNIVTQFDVYMYHTCQTHQSPLGLMAREENAIRILRTIWSRNSLEVSWWGRQHSCKGRHAIRDLFLFLFGWRAEYFHFRILASLVFHAIMTTPRPSHADNTRRLL